MNITQLERTIEAPHPIGFRVTYRMVDKKQHLEYGWFGEDGTPLFFKFAVGGMGPVTDAEIIALELEQLADAIRKKNREHRIRKKKK